MQRLLDELIDQMPPKPFERERIDREKDLFAERAALFYTPSSHLPCKWIGSGEIDVFLPLAVPTLMELFDNRYGHSPRLWVDLMQRATGYIRWSPMRPVKVMLTRYDVNRYGAHNLCVKQLVDSLKLRTSGRKDKVDLHYFGAIYDDNNYDMPSFQVREESVDDAGNACMRVQVSQHA